MKKPDSEKESKKSSALVAVPKSGKVSVMPGKTLAERIAELNEEYAVVLRGNQVLIMRHWVGADGVDQLCFLDRKGFEMLQENAPFIMENSAQKSMAKLWISSPFRKQYDQIYFCPDDKDYPGRYNLWRGFAYVPEKDKGDIEQFLSHIKDNICRGEPELYTWVLSFMADLIQKPWRKMGIALVLRGEMGVGKGVFARHIGKLFGAHYMTITQPGQIVGRFNSHLAGKVVIFMDEVIWTSESQGAGVMRSIITEPQITVEGKGRDAISVDNYCHLIVATNEHYAVPTGLSDERRMAVIDVGAGKIKDRAYFEGIRKDMEGGGYEALLYFLQNYKYDDSFLSAIPNTVALQEQKEMSLSNEIKWWKECLIAEQIGTDKIHETNSIEMDTKVLYASYMEYCNTMRIRPVPDSILPKYLKKFVSLEKYRSGYGVLRINKYRIPSIIDLRERFDKAIGHKVEWPKPESEMPAL